MENDNLLSESTPASKGVIYISIAKFYFILTGYCIYFYLTRKLGPEKFGIYSIILSLISVINAILIAGTLQAVSKFVSEDTRFANSIKRAALKTQAIISGITFLAFFFSANLIAALFNDPDLAFYFKIASPIIIFYSFYAVFIGYFNGLGNFKKQAFLDMTFSTIKTCLILIFVFLGFSVTGAISGFVLAALSITVLAALIPGVKTYQNHAQKRKILHFGILIMIFTLLTNLILNMDLFLVKALLPLHLANSYAGFYNAALSIARIPYQLIIPLTFVLFPLISKSTFQNDRLKTADYISKSLRYSYVMLLLLAVLISANSRDIISLLYSDKYVFASAPLSILAFGILFFSFFLISTVIISGSGKPRDSVKIAVFILLADILLNSLLIPKLHLVGAALATTSSLLAGLMLCVLYLHKKFGAFIPIDSLLKISVSAGLVYILSLSLKMTGLILLIKLFFLCVVYLLLLLLLKELKEKDINYIRSFLKFGK